MTLGSDSFSLAADIRLGHSPNASFTECIEELQGPGWCFVSCAVGLNKHRTFAKGLIWNVCFFSAAPHRHSSLVCNIMECLSHSSPPQATKFSRAFIFFHIGFLLYHPWLTQVYPSKQRQFHPCSLELESVFKSPWSYEGSEGKTYITVGSGLSPVAWWSASQQDSKHLTADVCTFGSL